MEIASLHFGEMVPIMLYSVMDPIHFSMRHSDPQIYIFVQEMEIKCSYDELMEMSVSVLSPHDQDSKSQDK